MAGWFKYLNGYSSYQFSPGTCPSVDTDRQARRARNSNANPSHFALTDTTENRELIGTELNGRIDFRTPKGCTAAQNEQRLEQAGLARGVQSGDHIEIRSRLNDR